MSKKPGLFKRVTQKIKKDNENGARQGILEDLFYDFHRSRVEVYKMNFIRGIFFGFGTVIGGTFVVALIVWLLGLLVDVPGGLGDFVRYIVSIVEER